MDCKTARMLVDFARPQAGDLDGADRADLERHLAGCAECDEWARQERLADQHLARAMRQVEVPDRLQAAIRSRLAEDCRDRKRKRLRRCLAGAAALAAVLLVGLGLYMWQAFHLPAPDIPGELERLKYQEYTAATNQSEIVDYFKKQGRQVDTPAGFNYSLLTAYGMAPFQGKQVPMLVFAGAKEGEYAQVYLLSPKQFDLKSLPATVQDTGGYRFKVVILSQEDTPQKFVIFHTGTDLRWLDQAEPAPAGDAQ